MGMNYQFYIDEIPDFAGIIIINYSPKAQSVHQ